MIDFSRVEQQALARYTQDAGNHVVGRGPPGGDTGDPLKILFVADVYGRPGRRAVEERLPGLREELGIDFCVVNGENAADGARDHPEDRRRSCSRPAPT